MPNNPRREARIAAREVRQDERRGKRQEKKYDSFLKQGDKEKMKLEKKYSPAQIKQIIDETPEGMRPPWMSSYSTPTTMKRGGATKYKMGGAKKYQPGGPTGRTKYEGPVTKEMTDINSKQFPETNIPFVSNAGSDMLKKYNENRDRRETGTGKTMSRGGATKKYMTGGMVNSNAKVSALKSAGSNGVKSGVNPKAKASTTAKGKTGGISKAPTKATPTKNKRK